MEGLVRPKSGTVEYLCNGDWVDVTEYSRKRMELRRIMSVMNQEFSMSVNSTVRDQIGFRLSMKKKGAIEHARGRPGKWVSRMRHSIPYTAFQTCQKRRKQTHCGS